MKAGCGIFSEEKRIQRLVEKIVRNRKTCSFDDLRRLLEAVGFTNRTGRGSHEIFKRGALRIAVPRRRPLKEHYVMEALRLIEALRTEDRR